MVTFTANDASGNQTTAQASIAVVDTTPPLITLPDDINMEGDSAGGADRGNAAVKAFLAAADATDIVDHSPVVTNDAPDLLALGETVLTFTATDASGNQTTAQVTVTVVDTTPPLVAAPPGITVEGAVAGGADQTNAAVRSFLNATRATDTVDPNPAITNDAPDLFLVGNSVVTFTATDASGNRATAQATITVLDQESPTAIPMPTQEPTPTAVTVPTPTAVPQPEIAILLTPEPTPTAIPGTPQPTPTSTPAPAPTGGGGCNAQADGAERVDAGWLLLGLVWPGLALARLRRWPWRTRS